MISARKHKWDHDNERRLAASEFTDGCARNERVCRQCGLTKVTIIPPQGFPHHQWCTKDGGVWVGEITPPCIETKPAEIITI